MIAYFVLQDKYLRQPRRKFLYPTYPKHVDRTTRRYPLGSTHAENIRTMSQFRADAFGMSSEVSLRADYAIVNEP